MTTYGEPVQNTTQNELNPYGPQGIALNQQAPPQVVMNVMNVNKNFGTKPVSMNCPFCKMPILSNVSRTCNFMTFLAFICTCWIAWCVLCCIHLYRNKEVTCCDAKHTCPNCGRTLGYYDNC